MTREAVMMRATEAVAEFKQSGGYWPESLEPLLTESPEFVQAYVRFAGHPWREGRLPPKVKALVSLALHASLTTLHAPGVRESCRVAIAHGASQAELLETLELISVIGVHACTGAVSALKPHITPDLADVDLVERARIKSDFHSKRGYWSEIWDTVLALDPKFLDAFTSFSSVPWERGSLEPRIKELIYIAVDVSATHMYTPGIHVHINNAVKHGAAPEEILEVMQLASSLGLSTFEVALPIILEEVARSEMAAVHRHT